EALLKVQLAGKVTDIDYALFKARQNPDKYVGEDGKVDVDALLKDHPSLKSQPDPKPGPAPTTAGGGGVKGFDMNAAIRKAAGLAYGQHMPVSGFIGRSGAQALMPEEVTREILQGMVQQSSVMQLATRAPNMSRAQRTIPVLSVLPEAYFVSGDTGLKNTSKQAWEKKFLNAEELAVIVPIPEAVLDDAGYDIWGEVRPR